MLLWKGDLSCSLPALYFVPWEPARVALHDQQFKIIFIFVTWTWWSPSAHQFSSNWLPNANSRWMGLLYLRSLSRSLWHHTELRGKKLPEHARTSLFETLSVLNMSIQHGNWRYMPKNKDKHKRSPLKTHFIHQCSTLWKLKNHECALIL